MCELQVPKQNGLTMLTNMLSELTPSARVAFLQQGTANEVARLSQELAAMNKKMSILEDDVNVLREDNKKLIELQEYENRRFAAGELGHAIFNIDISAQQTKIFLFGIGVGQKEFAGNIPYQKYTNNGTCSEGGRRKYPVPIYHLPKIIEILKTVLQKYNLESEFKECLLATENKSDLVWELYKSLAFYRLKENNFDVDYASFFNQKTLKGLREYIINCKKEANK